MTSGLPSRSNVSNIHETLVWLDLEMLVEQGKAVCCVNFMAEEDISNGPSDDGFTTPDL